MTIDVGDWLSQPAVGTSPEPCGLFIPPVVPGDGAEKPRHGVPVPLRRREVSATLYTDGCFADTEETLSYISDVDCTAVFRFPLPPRAAVYRFRAVFGDREVCTRVKPRSEAREEYALAVSQGHSAAHMSQHESGAALFEVCLGNLEAHTEVTVQLGYLRLLERLGTTLEWGHTATWVPPYVGSAGDVATGLDKVASSLPTFAPKVTYSLSYKIHVLAEAGAVRSIESPEPVTVRAPPPLQQPTPVPAAPATEVPAEAVDDVVTACGGGSVCGQLVQWEVALSEAVADPSKDLTLIIELDPQAASRSRLQVQRTPARAGSGGEGAPPRTVALATFVPPPPPGPGCGPGCGPATAPLRKELWFVVDCSGSMEGTPIRQAREAALFFVRDLPAGSDVRFNVTCFGSTHVSLWPDCRPYGPATEAEALAWLQRHVQADMGGTEILATLRHIYDTPITPGFTRELLFLTDGGISGHEEQAVYDLVGGAGRGPYPAAARRTHVLCLGIGHGVHRGLLDGMAARSHGVAVYVVDEEAIAAKAGFIKRAATARGAALRPRLSARGALVRAAPHVLPQRLFAGEPLHVLLEVLSCEPDATLELTAEYGEEAEAEAEAGKGRAAAPPPPLRLSLPLGASAGPGAAAPQQGEALGVLHAMAYIGCLLSGSSPLHVRPDGSPLPQPPPEEVVRDAVVRLAVAEHLITPYTSAVGVALRRDAGEPGAGSAPTVEVPLQLPHGRQLWGAQPQQGYDSNAVFLCTAPGGGGGPSFPGRALRMARGSPPAMAPCAAAPMLLACSARGIGDELVEQGRMIDSLDGLAASSECFAKKAAKGGSGGLGSMLRGIANVFGGARSAARPAAAPPPPRPAPAPAPSYAMASSAAVQSAGPAAFHGLVPAYDVSSAEEASGGAADVTNATNGADESGSWPAARSRNCALARAVADEEDQEEEEAEAPARPAPPPPPCGPLSGSALLEYLNLTRDTRGFWSASPELAAALGVPPELLMPQPAAPSPAPAAAAAAVATPATQAPAPASALATAAALRPPGATDECWASVVVLARLRVSLSGQRGVWADMEAKALAWLGGAWPAGARSVGSTVLALAKALQALP